MFKFKKYPFYLAVIAFSFVNTIVIADDEMVEVKDQAKQECANTEMETIALSSMTVLDKNADFNQYKNEQLAKINKIADELKLKAFKITSSDISVNRSHDRYDVSFSVSIESEVNDKAFTAFVRGTKMYNASQSVYEMEKCKG